MIIVSPVICDRTDAIFIFLGRPPQNIMTPGERFVMALSTAARSVVLEVIAHGRRAAGRDHLPCRSVPRLSRGSRNVVS